jgi:hypothetical protein
MNVKIEGKYRFVTKILRYEKTGIWLRTKQGCWHISQAVQTQALKKWIKETKFCEKVEGYSQYSIAMSEILARKKEVAGEGATNG